MRAQAFRLGIRVRRMREEPLGERERERVRDSLCKRKPPNAERSDTEERWAATEVGAAADAERERDASAEALAPTAAAAISAS